LCPSLEGGTKTILKYISQKTSYIPVRLAYHLLAQVFQDSCNKHWFVPPRPYSGLFRLLILSSPGFESNIDKLFSSSLRLLTYLSILLTGPLYKRYSLSFIKDCDACLYPVFHISSNLISSYFTPYNKVEEESV